MPRFLAALGIGLFLALGAGGLAAAADENEHGEDQVTIFVTIDRFDPCAADAPGCAGGDLAITGTAIGVPLGAGILLVAFGAGAYALASHRRSGAA